MLPTTGGRKQFLLSRASTVTLPSPHWRDEVRLELRPDTKTLRDKTGGMQVLNRNTLTGRLRHSCTLECSSHFLLRLTPTRIACTQKPPWIQGPPHPRHTVGPQPDTKPDREAFLVPSQCPPDKLGPLSPPYPRLCGKLPAEEARALGIRRSRGRLWVPAPSTVAGACPGLQDPRAGRGWGGGVGRG